MLNSIRKNRAPHVVSTMHFNVERFKELYQWINALQMDAIAVSITPYHYGLVHFENPETDFQLEITGNNLWLHQACGLASNGSLAGILKGYSKLASYDLAENLGFRDDGIYEIFLAIDNQTRIPVGEWDGQEVPKREPFSIPKQFLVSPFDLLDEVKDIKTLKDQAFPNSLRIGLVEKANDQYSLKKYIPSCVHVGAHSLLWKKVQDYEKIAGDFIIVIEKIAKITDSELDIDRSNLRKLIMPMGEYLIREIRIFEFSEKNTPNNVFNFWKGLAQLMNFHLKSLIRRSQLIELIRQNVTDYIGQEFKPQGFSSAIVHLEQEKYNHSNFLANMIVIDHFIEVIFKGAFKLLSENNFVHPLETKETVIPIPPKKTGKNSRNSGSFF